MHAGGFFYVRHLCTHYTIDVYFITNISYMNIQFDY